MENETIKEEFGRRLRIARDTRKLSRAALGIRLGISPKTIQSWEMGRTFIEDLALFPLIESELQVSVSHLISQAYSGGKISDSFDTTSTLEPINVDSPRPGPLHPIINMATVTVDTDQIPDDDALDIVAVPMLRDIACGKDVSSLSKNDIERYVSIPATWVPRGGVLIACRMGDSGMDPTIPLGAIIIVDRRPPMPVERFIEKIVMMEINQKNKGIRVRRLVQNLETMELEGATAIPHKRGRVTSFKPELGDAILGRVIGVLSQPL